MGMFVSAKATVKVSVALVTGLFAALTIPNAAQAVPTPDPATVEYCGGSSADCSNVPGTTSYSYSDITGSISGTASASYTNGTPVLSAHGTAEGGYSINVHALVNYYFYVFGPTNVLARSVPLEVSAEAATAAGTNIGIAYALVDANGVEISACSGLDCAGAYPSSLGAGFDGTFSIGDASVIDGVSIEGIVSEQVDVNGSGGSGSASLDPQLSIDPTWLVDHPGYSLVVSPDLPTGVPEPFTLSLFGAGLAGAAVLRRRKGAQKA